MKTDIQQSMYPYLTFNGNCSKAMAYYQSIFGGALSLQAIGGSPLSANLPDKMKDCILHAELKTDRFLLMGTDLVPEMGLIKGNSVSIYLRCHTVAAMEKIYTQLSGKPLEPHSFSGAVFANATDPFGTNWLLHCDGNSVSATQQVVK